MTLLWSFLALAVLSSTDPSPAGLRSPTGSTPDLIAQAVSRGEVDAETGWWFIALAIKGDGRLPVELRGKAPWDGTLPLLHLRRALPGMRASAARDEIERLLTGVCGSSSNALPNVRNSTHFHVQYGTIGGGLAIGDYETVLETSWTKEITSFGWAAPPVLASNPPPGNRYAVRIDSLSAGLYGFASTSGAHAGYLGDNPNTSWNDGTAFATCIVLNRDYDSGFPGAPLTALQATGAHEFHHAVQFGYGALTGSNVPDDAFVEGGATWMEDEVFDTANDNYYYLWPNFPMCMGSYTDDPYRYWIVFRGLTERFGNGTAGGAEQVMQDFWETTSRSTSTRMLAALDQALQARGTTLADAYHAFAVAVKFAVTFKEGCSGNFAYPYCLEEGPDYVSAAGAVTPHATLATVGESADSTVAENYGLRWIRLPGGSTPYRVVLENTSIGGSIRASLVCDTGTNLSVTPMGDPAGAGETRTVDAFDPTGCATVIAVITNQARTSDHPTSCSDRSFRLSTAAATVTLAPASYLPSVVHAL